MSNLDNVQLEMFPTALLDTVESDTHEKIYATAFRKLYYHLYSNSSASRAERIIADLSNLLLVKVASERATGRSELDKFLAGHGTANEILMPFLRREFPLLIDVDDKFSLDDTVLRYGLNELSHLPFESAPAHILGEAFQALIGPRLRGDKGQFFTPKSLVRSMVSILNPPIGAKIVDPACGTGGFLVEASAFRTQYGCGSKEQKQGLLIGMDKDLDLSRLSQALLQTAAPGQAVVYNVNSLDLSNLALLPAELSPLQADYVLTNPPFGAKIKVTDKSILLQYALGYRWREGENGWLQGAELLPAQDPQILFIELCVQLLRAGGHMGVVLPEGVFGNSGWGYVWDYLRSQGEITALLDCPRTTFQPSTDTKTNILFFRKVDQPAQSARSTGKVWTAVALHCGHDQRGRSTRASGEKYPDDFQEIGASYIDRESGSGFWQLVDVRNPYYLVPRYYDSSPLKELRQEAQRLGTKLISLGEMTKKGFLRIRKGHEVGAEAYGTGDVPFIRTSDLTNYEVSIDPTRSVAEEFYERYAHQQQLAPGDILMVNDGRYRIGRTAILHDHNFRCIIQSHIRIISVEPQSPIDAFELLYLLNLPMVQHQIRNLVFIQSTLGSLGKRASEICIPLPDQTAEWKETIAQFRALIENRAKLLRSLRDFEHPGYEL